MLFVCLFLCTVEAKATTGVSRRVRSAYSTLDALNFRLGQALRRRPAARGVLFAYMVVLHFWVAFVLVTYSPETHPASSHGSPDNLWFRWIDLSTTDQFRLLVPCASQTSRGIRPNNRKYSQFGLKVYKNIHNIFQSFSGCGSEAVVALFSMIFNKSDFSARKLDQYKNDRRRLFRRILFLYSQSHTCFSLIISTQWCMVLKSSTELTDFHGAPSCWSIVHWMEIQMLSPS